MLPKPNDRFEWLQAAAGPALVCRALEPYAASLFTTRPWPLGTADVDAREAAWGDVARAIGVEPQQLARIHQVHGAAIVVRRRGALAPPATAPLPAADVVVSDDPSLALAVQTADCVPLLIADPRSGAVAAAHAGWRGLAAGVPGVAVRALADAFGSRPADLIAAVGPSICAQRYEVDDAVREAFAGAGHNAAPPLRRWFLDGVRTAHWQFDGWAAARDQLAAAGVADDRIHVAGLCTASHPELLCSYRRDGKAAGRMAAVIRARRE
jgi:purine-nucleoside/S-methyl-5'-thioadenosine phosphorylase / adenosine deaminase